MAQPWSDVETRRLIQLWGEDDVQCQLEGCKRNKAIYERLARSMLPDYERNGSQCREKIKKLKAEYKKIKDKNGKTGRGRKTMKFYDELNDILGTRPATRPAVLVDSSASTVATDAAQPGVTEPTEGNDANSNATPATATGNGAAEETGPSASAEEPAAPEKTKQQQIGKKRALKEEQFERAMDTAIKKLNAANEESDSKYFELEEKRLKLEERAMETQMQQRQEFQQMVCCAFLQTFSSTPLLFMYIP